MPRLLESAIVCGATPLLIGTLIYVWWCFTRSEWLMIAGLVNIVAGLVMFVIGTICLSMRSRKTLVSEPSVHRGISAQRVLAGGLLLSNFPVALLILLSAHDVMTRYTVKVINESENTIESFVVAGPGVNVEMGSIAPSSGKTLHLHFKGDGVLNFSGRRGEKRLDGQIEGCVTGNLSGKKTVRVTQDGAVMTEQ